MVVLHCSSLKLLAGCLPCAPCVLCRQNCVCVVEEGDRVFAVLVVAMGAQGLRVPSTSLRKPAVICSVPSPCKSQLVCLVSA